MLPEVVHFLKLQKHHEMFLEINGLLAIGKWLAPLPDGSIPCRPIKEHLLQALLELPISVDHLTEAGVGQ